MNLILAILTSSMAQANQKSLKSYGIGASCTMLSIPITYAGASILIETSNQLVPGLLPPVLFGVLLPSSSATFSTKWALTKGGYTVDKPNLIYSATVLSNIALYAGGTVLGVSSDQFGEVLVYGLVTSALLPLPTWLMSKNPDASISLSVTPTDNGPYLSGGYRVDF